MDFSISSHLLRKVRLNDETRSLKILKFCPHDITVLGDINVEISPLANPTLVRFASLIKFFMISWKNFNFNKTRCKKNAKKLKVYMKLPFVAIN